MSTEKFCLKIKCAVCAEEKEIMVEKSVDVFVCAQCYIQEKYANYLQNKMSPDSKPKGD